MPASNQRSRWLGKNALFSRMKIPLYFHVTEMPYFLTIGTKNKVFYKVVLSLFSTLCEGGIVMTYKPWHIFFFLWMTRSPSKGKVMLFLLNYFQPCMRKHIFFMKEVIASVNVGLARVWKMWRIYVKDVCERVLVFFKHIYFFYEGQVVHVRVKSYHFYWVIFNIKWRRHIFLWRR